MPRESRDGVQVAETGQFVFIQNIFNRMSSAEVIENFFEQMTLYDEGGLRDAAPDGVFNWLLYASTMKSSSAKEEGGEKCTGGDALKGGAGSEADLLDAAPRKSSSAEEEGEKGTGGDALKGGAGRSEATVGFICTQTLSAFEIGTDHLALGSRLIGVDRIYAGGELSKVGGDFTFNLESGSYTQPMVQWDSKKVGAFYTSIEKEILKLFPNAVVERRSSRRYGGSGSMSRKVSEVPMAVLDLYKSFGYTVRLFDSRLELSAFSASISDVLSRVVKSFADFAISRDVETKAAMTAKVLVVLKEATEMVGVEFVDIQHFETMCMQS